MKVIIRANKRVVFVIALIAALMISTGCSIDLSSIGASVQTVNQSVEENADDSESSDEYDEYDEEEEEDFDLEEDEQAIESKLNCTVWTTKTGSCYHTEGCSYLKSKAGSMTQKEAIKKGLSPCSRCITGWYYISNWADYK